MGRRVITGVLAFAMVLVGLPFAATSAAAVSPDIVISQVYGGGGNLGATLKNDFIELYNRGTATVDVTGWSVQYASSGGTAWSPTGIAGVIAPGRYYLVQEAAGTGGSTDLPAPNASGNIAMSATAGKVALRTSTAAFSGACPVGAVDLVGYGAASCSETTPTGVLSNTTAAIRKLAGAQDTDSNLNDFTIGAPTPRNTADHAPTVAATTPASSSGGVAANANITVTFSEPVNVAGSWFSIGCGVSGAHAATVSGGPTTFTLDPDSDFSAAGETCIARVFAANVTDQDTEDPPDRMVADYQWSFAVVLAALSYRIHDVQGAGHISPFVGSTVPNVPGIVTQLRAGGFYMQDPAPDADDRTSEGISVTASTGSKTVALGDSVTVTGVVSELRTATGNLSTTTLTGIPTILSTGNPLPAPIVIGAAGRMPPTEVIEDDATGDVDTSGVFDPANDGIDFWESLEGMRVNMGLVIVTGPSPFDELGILANNGAGATSRTARGGIVITAGDKNPEKILMRGVGFSMPKANTGDHFAEPIVGVVGFDFGNFMLEVPTAPTRIADGVTREIATAPSAHELTMATFNVENLDPGDPTFPTMADLIVNRLLSPDVISLEEIQDNDGETNSHIVDATATLTKLRDAIVTAGGPTYQWRQIDPVDLADGGAPGGNIRQVFFFRTDRGVAFVDRPGAGSTTANSVVNAAGEPQLQYSPGRIDPTNSAFNSSRKPLAGEFTYNGHHLIVVANHWNSKGGDDALWGHAQPPVLSSEVQRRQQATIVKSFVQSIFAVKPSAEVVVLGDLNDFEFSTPLLILKSAPMNDLIETLPANERYTYVFEGNSQTLDHIVVSNSLLALHARTDVVHVNSEFWDQASDHEPQVATLPLFDTTRPTVTAPANVSTTTGALSCSAVVSDAVLGTATASDDNGSVTIVRTGVPAGNIFPVGVTTITYTATDGSGNTATATQTVTVTDDADPSVTAPADASYQLLSLVPTANASDATASDNCGAPTVTVTQTSNGGAGSPASPLVITRVYTATDGAGNHASATQTITVIDDTPPTIHAPVSLTRSTGAAATTCSAFIGSGLLGVPAASDNSGTVNVVRTGVPVTFFFPVGVTTITYTATDPSGNTATATQTVTIVDDTPPTITAPANASYQLASQVPAGSTADATVSDNCGAVTVTLAESSNGGAGSPVSPLIITRIYTATDGAGNHATATQTITIIDNTAPTITAAAAPAPNANGWNNTAVTVTFTCADNSGVVSCPAPVTLTADGAGQSVSGTATDGSGNSATATVSGINIDRTLPAITFTGATSYTLDQTVNITCTYTDALSGIDPAKLNTCGTASGPAYSFLGTNTLSASATDRAGNTATATFTFTVGVDSRALCALVQRVVDKDGVAKSLCTKIEKAAERLAEGRDKNFENELKAFTNEVNAQRGKAISDANATLLIDLAGRL